MSHCSPSYLVPKQSHEIDEKWLTHRDPTKHKFSRVSHLLWQPSTTFSCLEATSGVIGSRSDAALPLFKTMFLMQPTNDSMMYFTPWSFSSELKPEKIRIFVKNSFENFFEVHLQLEQPMVSSSRRRNSCHDSILSNKPLPDGRQPSQSVWHHARRFSPPRCAIHHDLILRRRLPFNGTFLSTCLLF